jgi:two-component system OmpR family response regulator
MRGSLNGRRRPGNLRIRKVRSVAVHAKFSAAAMRVRYDQARLSGSARPYGVGVADVKVLLIEDDADTAAYVAEGLGEQGHVVDRVADGRLGARQAAEAGYDVLIVDRMLPGLDGLSLVKTIRAAGVRTPVLFLSTLGGLDDRVTGLEAGGDDYLVKPFAFSELAARVSALGRRPPLTTVLRICDLEMNLLERTVTRQGKPIELQPREFRLLEYLLRHAGQVVTRTMLLESVWDFHFDPKTTVVETHMSRLRAKIDRDFDPELIHTVRGHGYSVHAAA